MGHTALGGPLEDNMNPGPMEFGWYFRKVDGPPGQQFGPFTWEQLVADARTGLIGPNDLVWNEQLPTWEPAWQITGLVAAAPPSYQPAAPPQYGPPTRRRSPWAWLAPLIAVILIGGGVGAYFAFWYGAVGSAIEDIFSEVEGEILLEPSGTAGPDSFAGEQFLPIGPTTTLRIPSPAITLPPVTTTTLAQATTTAGAQPAGVAPYTPDTPALSGGSKS